MIAGPTPLILLDQPDDGWCETLGWADTTLTEDQARDALAPFCADEDGELGYRPIGEAKRVLLKPDPEVPDMWIEAQAGEKDAAEFWEVIVA